MPPPPMVTEPLPSSSLPAVLLLLLFPSYQWSHSQLS